MKTKTKIKWSIAGVTSMMTLGLFAAALSSNRAPLEVKAASYSTTGGGFSKAEDDTVSASFTVTDNSLDMKGWLLCLFESAPSVDSSNKLTDSNDAHPYSYADCKHYFFASNVTKTGSITVSWDGKLADQKENWSSDEVNGATGKTLKDYLENGTNWHIVIGPRHYNTGWGDSGIGAGTNGYWENCDYYVGKMNDLFSGDSSEKEMSISAISSIVDYNGQDHSVDITVLEPSSGYSIAYRTSSAGEYNLTSAPTYKDAGYYTIYFQVSAEGYTTYEGSVTLQINKAEPEFTSPSAKLDLVYNGQAQELLSGGSSNVVYSLDGETYYSEVPTGINAGTYSVYYKVEETTNYQGVRPSAVDITIGKKDGSFVTAPSPKLGLNYTGESQVLIFEGVSDGGTVLYSLDGIDYASTPPTGLNSGTYTVYYQIEGDDNHNALEPSSFEVIISPNDKTALNDVITEAKDYYESLLPNYPDIAKKLQQGIISAKAIADSSDDKTVSEIDEAKEDLLLSYDIAHAEVVDAIIEGIGEVRYSSKFFSALENADNALAALSQNQKELIDKREALENAHTSYKLLKEAVEAIEGIGEVTYDETAHNRILAAEQALVHLSENERRSIPTYRNDLQSSIDIYTALEEIANLGEIEYSEEFHLALREARFHFDALDPCQQKAIANYEELMEAERVYQEVDEVVALIEAIPDELEYVGTHQSDIDNARSKYKSLSSRALALLPQACYEALVESETEYEALKEEHETKEVENVEKGVSIAFEGSSGIPDTLTIDIRGGNAATEKITDSIDYQTIASSIPKNEDIAAIAEIKLVDTASREASPLCLNNLEEDLSATIELDVPIQIEDTDFKILLLDEENAITDVEYTFDPISRKAIITSSKLGTFAIVEVHEETLPDPALLPWAIIGSVSLTASLAAMWLIPFFKGKIIILG